jgi:hypothetical protein
MVGFLKCLFGGGQAAPQAAAASLEYKGYIITPTPMSEGGQFRLCGVITKDIDGEMKEHKFIRADVCQSKEQAIDLAEMKGKQVIDQLGDRLFQS